MSPTGVVLVGSRGTGKSTVGRILADRLSRRFVDVDEQVEASLGLSIASIFSMRGESVFRDAEEAAIRRLAESIEPIVLATGGGAVLRAQNRERLKQLGFVVWLTAEPSVMADRLRLDADLGKPRPSLTGSDAIAEIEAVLEARRGLYQNLADFVVDTSRISPDEVAEALIFAVKEADR